MGESQLANFIKIKFHTIKIKKNEYENLLFVKRADWRRN